MITSGLISEKENAACLRFEFVARQNIFSICLYTGFESFLRHVVAEESDAQASVMAAQVSKEFLLNASFARIRL